MDLSCIISSGDLELYALGILPADEATKIEQLALMFPEVQEELDRISETLMGLGAASQLAPSPLVKDGLMQRLQQLEADEEAQAAPVVSLQTGRYPDRETSTQEATHEAPVVTMPSERVSRMSWLNAASFIGFLLALGGVIFLFSKDRQNRSEIAALQRNVQNATGAKARAEEDLAAANQMVAMLQNDVYKKIQLKAVPGKPDALVQLMWNTQTKEVFIADISLPQTPAGHQYQLWAIVDGKPVDAGLVGGAKRKVQQMKTFNRAEAFAITLEREGGSPQPTLEQMFVMGGA